jgi:predicted adenylyl cyclase CyaB
MIEIEQRYKVTGTDAIISRLVENGLTQTTKDHIIDEWFAPLDVQSHERQREWFDGEHGLAYRVRRVEQSDGRFVVKVETKQLTSDDNHNTFAETVIDIHNYEEAHTFLEEKGYWNWLTIDKTRRTFDSDEPELEIVLDEIEGLAEKIGVGAALEIEYKGEADRDTALEKIGTFAAALGLQNDQLFEKSLTVEAMVELAKFKESTS